MAGVEVGIVVGTAMRAGAVVVAMSAFGIAAVVQGAVGMQLVFVMQIW